MKSQQVRLRTWKFQVISQSVLEHSWKGKHDLILFLINGLISSLFYFLINVELRLEQLLFLNSTQLVTPSEACLYLTFIKTKRHLQLVLDN